MISFRITLTKAKEVPQAHVVHPFSATHCPLEPVPELHLQLGGGGSSSKDTHGGREINKISTGPIDLPSEQFNSQGGEEAAGRRASSLLF